MNFAFFITKASFDEFAACGEGMITARRKPLAVNFEVENPHNDDKKDRKLKMLVVAAIHYLRKDKKGNWYFEGWGRFPNEASSNREVLGYCCSSEHGFLYFSDSKDSRDDLEDLKVKVHI